MYYFLFFNATTARSECQFLWNKTDFNFSEFFLFHNMESSIELACLSSFWWRDTFTIDLTSKVKAQAELNFAKCLSHPSCLLISSAISFSFYCLLFSLQLTVPGKCFIISFVSFKLLLDIFLVPLLLLDPLRPRWGLSYK